MPFLAAAGLISEPPLPAERDRLAAATPLIQERINTLSEAVGLLAFLFLPDDKITIARRCRSVDRLDPDAEGGLRGARRGARSFDHASVESALRTALIDNLGLKPRLAFGPVRAAITGSRISPPLFESIELLGRESTLARIAAALAELGQPDLPDRASGAAPMPDHET